MSIYNSKNKIFSMRVMRVRRVITTYDFNPNVLIFIFYKLKIISYFILQAIIYVNTNSSSCCLG